MRLLLWDEVEEIGLLEVAEKGEMKSSKGMKGVN